MFPLSLIQVHALDVDEIGRPLSWKKNNSKQKKEGIIIEKPADLIIHLYVTAMRSIVNPDFLYYQKMSYKEAIQSTFEILFNGILTPNGKKQFKKSFYTVLK